LGILSQIDIISAVSGGSILAGFLGSRWTSLRIGQDSVIADWCREVQEPFLELTAGGSGISVPSPSVCADGG